VELRVVVRLYEGTTRQRSCDPFDVITFGEYLTQFELYASEHARQSGIRDDDPVRDQRIGQCAFNALRLAGSEEAGLAERISGSARDPYSLDPNLPAFLRYLHVELPG
jgi:hypothetical protein